MALKSTEVLIPFDNVPTGHHTGTTRPVVSGVDAPISWKNVIIKWQGEWHSFDENPWRRHVLDINLALFYVVHVVHGLLKFGECYSFNIVLRKIPGIWSFAVGKNVDMERWDLIATIIPESAIFWFVIQSDHATFILEYPHRVSFYIYASIFYCNFLFHFSFSNDICDILHGFSANSFFLPYHVCKQFILSFQTIQTIFFNICYPPLPSRETIVRP